MRSALDAMLIIGFVVVDWLRFHDLLKPEAPAAADWLTLLLSIGVFYAAVEFLLRRLDSRRAPSSS